MKKVILIVFALVTLYSCKKEETIAPTPIVSIPSQITSQGDYWGCWKDIASSASYNIILTNNTPSPHGFQLGTLCVPNASMPVQNIGVFRNDTLIFDNGTFEYWCHVVNDTMTYSAYTSSQPVIKLTK